MHVQQFVLEYATPRAGDIAVVGEALADREIGLGVVNPRTATAEAVAEIVARVEAALRYFTPSQVFLNPDCGFGCFANRCVNDETTAAAKLRGDGGGGAGAARAARDLMSCTPRTNWIVEYRWPWR